MIIFLIALACMLISTAVIGAAGVAVRAYNALSPYLRFSHLDSISSGASGTTIITFLKMVNAWFPLDDFCVLISSYCSIFIAVWLLKRTLNAIPEILGCTGPKY